MSDGKSKPAPLEPLPPARGALLTTILGAAALAALVLLAWWWLFWRVNVAPGETLRVTRSFGKDNPDTNMFRVIPQTEEMKGVKGVLEQVYGEGNYFFNPILFKTEIDRPRRRGQFDTESLVTIKPGFIGVVTSQSGRQLEAEGQFLVDWDDPKERGSKGTLRQVLTPGRYRINPRAFKVEIVPAKIIEPGYVGVVTSQTGKPSQNELAEEGEIGVMREVLQPGIYHLNPKAYKVHVMEIGYREHTINGIRFPSQDGYPIECDITVIWGIHPDNAPYIVKNIGKTDEEIKRKVIDQVVQSASRIKGGEFSAAQLVSGADRQRFVDEFTSKLKEECEGDNRIDILRGLIRRISIPTDIREPIQQVKIQRERELTLADQQTTQEKRNELEEVKGDVAKKIKVTQAETTKQVAQARETGMKKAAEIAAQAEAEIAEILAEVAKTEAEIDRVQGQGKAVETKLLEEAQADRFTQIVKAFGSPEAYTRYVFATSLPDDFRVVLRYAGPGTFWTDLPTEFKALESAAALKILEKSQQK